MIIEILGNLIFGLLSVLLSGFEAVGLPLDAIQTLATITKYGSFVVGADLLVLLFSSFVFFIGVRLGTAAFMKLWDMLPFT